MTKMMQINYVDMEHDVKPNLCEMFQEEMFTNGKYNNAFVIIMNALVFMLFGPLYAIIFSFPVSIIFSMVASCNCFCFVLDMQTAGTTIGILLLPFRLVQMLLVIAIAVIFNVLFWAIMIIPVYILCFSWGARMIYYWTCGHKVASRPRVQVRRISEIYNKKETQNASVKNNCVQVF